MPNNHAWPSCIQSNSVELPASFDRSAWNKSGWFLKANEFLSGCQVYFIVRFTNWLGRSGMHGEPDWELHTQLFPSCGAPSEIILCAIWQACCNQEKYDREYSFVVGVFEIIVVLCPVPPYDYHYCCCCCCCCCFHCCLCRLLSLLLLSLLLVVIAVIVVWRHWDGRNVSKWGNSAESSNQVKLPSSSHHNTIVVVVMWRQWHGKECVQNESNAELSCPVPTIISLSQVSSS